MINKLKTIQYYLSDRIEKHSEVKLPLLDLIDQTTDGEYTHEDPNYTHNISKYDFVSSFVYSDSTSFSPPNLRNMYSWTSQDNQNDVSVHIKTSLTTRNESSFINPSMHDSLLQVA